MNRVFTFFIIFFALISCAKKSTTLKSVELTSQLPKLNGVVQELPVGETEQFKAIGVFDDNHWEDKSSLVQWSTNTECPASSSSGSSGDAVATVSSDGIVTGVAGGTVFLVAVLDTFIGCYELTVSGAALVSIEINPPTATIVSGTTQQFTATGIYADSTTRDITTSVAWASNVPSIATVATSGSTRGLATGKSPGSVLVIAVYKGITTTASLTVTPATLLSISVTPTNPSVALGLSKQFTATGTYSDNSTQDITNSVVWASNDGAVASVNVTGLASSLDTGSAVISATLGAVSGNSTLTVTAAELVSITVTPASTSVALGLTKQFTATGNYTDGTQQDITATVVWFSSVTGVATISNGGGSAGRASSVSEGNTEISAASGLIYGSTTFTVTSAALVSIDVTPNIPSVAKGIPQQFIATGTYTDGTTQVITNAVVWSTSDPLIATVSNAVGTQGKASTIGVGNATITATSGAVSGNEVLTVTAAVLQSIAVTPNTATITKTATRQYTATGTYSDGTTPDITALVTWSSSSISTATISNAGGSNGLATGVNTGFVTFRATLGAIQGSANATVIP